MVLFNSFNGLVLFALSVNLRCRRQNKRHIQLTGLLLRLASRIGFSAPAVGMAGAWPCKHRVWSMDWRSDATGPWRGGRTHARCAHAVRLRGVTDRRSDSGRTGKPHPLHQRLAVGCAARDAASLWAFCRRCCAAATQTIIARRHYPQQQSAL